MADYSQMLQQLKNTEGWFQRETKPYKDFRNALKNLNDGMRKAGNRALPAGEVQKLRELTAKAKEAWDIYYGQMQDDEIDFAWQRTEKLQNAIRESMKRKWKSETSLQKGAIHILDENSPAWGKLELSDLKTNYRNNERKGFFSAAETVLDSFDRAEAYNGFHYGARTREGVRRDRYKPTRESTVFEYLRPVDYPDTGQNLSDHDIFLFYRNRRTLHNDQEAIGKAARCFRG